MNRTKKPNQLNLPIHGEQGFVLALCLILLLIMTILGVTALNTSVSEEGMARDIQQSIRAFQNAETGGVLASKTLNEVMQRAAILEANPGRDKKSIPETLPANLLYADFKNQMPLKHGNTEFIVRRTGKIDGPTPSCRSVKDAQSGGCTRFYNFKSTGQADEMARASISGAGCVFTHAQGDGTNAATGAKCN